MPAKSFAAAESRLGKIWDYSIYSKLQRNKSVLFGWEGGSLAFLQTWPESLQ